MAELLLKRRMQLTLQQSETLDHFLAESNFVSSGALITDLDGTAVHEVDGKVIVHSSVEIGLKKIHDRKHPVIINTLRFPLSVIRTFGKDWYKMTNAAIPVILLNGSQLGYITKVGTDFSFEQLESFPLHEKDIDLTMATISQLFADGINKLVLFYYPEDWTKGEIIWTPDPSSIQPLQEKYKSASTVISTDILELTAMLKSQKICMMLLLVEIPGDKRMAYQQTKRDNFITRSGVDKLWGARKMADHLKFKLEDSIGAGDSAMDVFLNGMGLSVQVGLQELDFQGKRHTIKVPGFHEFADLLSRCAEREPVSHQY